MLIEEKERTIKYKVHSYKCKENSLKSLAKNENEYNKIKHHH